MRASAVETLTSLYEEDETAWLEQMAQLVAEGRLAELDCPNLQDFLSSMAGRDRREVVQRLITLIAHRLKWEHQPDKRTTSWRATIAEQRRELAELLESKTLRNHAEDMLAKVYAHAVEQAAIETEMAESAFPVENPHSLDEWLAKE